MKCLRVILLVVVILSGCTLTPPNQYLEIQNYADANAPYIGEWTAGVGVGLTALKINKDGMVKACSSNPEAMGMNGKVYKKLTRTYIIIENGRLYEIFEMNVDYFMATGGTQLFKFQANQVPEECIELFKNFE